MENTDKKNYSAALVTLTTLFFMWGFITCLNDLLTPFLKGVFELSHFEANLVQFAFFAAYFVISLIYFLVSSSFGDPIQKIGYKNTLVMGLLIAAAACFLFFVEAGSTNPKFELFLASLFLLGTGFTFLQIAANPLVSILGTSDTASSRLNMSQAFNSLGTTLAPVIGGYFIFTYFKGEGESASSASAVQIPYLVLASVLLVLAGILFFSNVPNKVGEKAAEVRGAGALKHPYLVFGMIGIFCYVGAEVSIGNNLIGFMDFSCKIPTEVATTYLMFYWGGAMIGRFMGAISMSKLPANNKYLLMGLAGILTAAIIVFIASSKPGFDLSQVPYFVGFLALNYLVFISAKSLPSRTLGFFAIINVCLLVVMLLFNGSVSLWAVLSIGLFNSIMFSNVFTLAIDGLEEYTAQGSSLLVMMILGGAIVPPLQGLLTDVFSQNSVNLKFAFLVPLVCYIYLAWYGFVGSGIGKQKNIVVKKEEHPESIVLRND